MGRTGGVPIIHVSGQRKEAIERLSRRLMHLEARIDERRANNLDTSYDIGEARALRLALFALERLPRRDCYEWEDQERQIRRASA